MIKIGYMKCEYNCCIYAQSLDDHSHIFLLLYVHDVLIAAKSTIEVNKLKDLLSKEFGMKDLSAAKKILGMVAHKDRKARRLRYLRGAMCKRCRRVLTLVMLKLWVHFWRVI